MDAVNCKNCVNYIREWCEAILDSPDPTSIDIVIASNKRQDLIILNL